MNSFFRFPDQQQLEGIGEAFQKITIQCNEDRPFKDIHKDTTVKLGTSHLSKVTPC
jgi:hypothetical protein